MKNQEKTKIQNGNMIFSIFMLFLSVVLFCGYTFAYFTSSSKASSENIVSAYYQLEIQIGEKTEIATNENPYSVFCESDTTFILRATGNASSGFCMIEADKEVFNTVLIPRNGEFTVHCAAGKTIQFAPSWIIKNAGTVESGMTIGTLNASVLIEEEIADSQYELHTVVLGETLEMIAVQYGLSVEEICEYNDFSSDLLLVEGQQIAIPRKNTQNDSQDDELEPTDSPIPTIEPTFVPSDESELNSTNGTEEIPALSDDTSSEPLITPTIVPTELPNESEEISESEDLPIDPTVLPTAESNESCEDNDAL